MVCLSFCFSHRIVSVHLALCPLWRLLATHRERAPYG